MHILTCYVSIDANSAIDEQFPNFTTRSRRSNHIGYSLKVDTACERLVKYA